MKKTLWLQPDDWNPDVLTTQAWAEVVYVFDPTWLAKRPHSLKQIQFIYEAITALPLPVTIYRGYPAAIFDTAAAAPGKIAVVEPRDCELRQHLGSLQSSIQITWLPRSTWLRSPDQPSERFFKYWNAVKKQI